MWPNTHFPADLVILTEEILNGKLNFLCSVRANKEDHKNHDFISLDFLH